MVSLESQSTPREVGSEYGAWSGASDGLHTAGEVPPPPRGTPLSFVWRAKWVVLVLVVVCGAAALLALSVHPHARGESGAGDLGAYGLVGSPPRPWGIRHAHRHERLRVRFTPTPVGNPTPPQQFRSV